MSSAPAKARAKGTRTAERVCGYLRDHGFPFAERRAQYGAYDRGDVVGVPGFALEIKSVLTPAYEVWLREAETERVNAGADYGAVIHKPRGIDEPGRYRVVMTLATFCALVREDTNPEVTV